MLKRIPILILATFSPTLLFPESANWSQWRGAGRNGKGDTRLEIDQFWTNSGPRLIWESSPIPSQDDGGFGSIISDGKVAYVSLVWHRDEPTETRTISSLFLRKFGARKVNLPPELVAKAEKARLNLSPRLRGSNLDEWIENWIEENLDQKQKMTQGGLITSRFKQGKLAFNLSDADLLFSVRDKVFPNQDALDQWLEEQPFDPEIRAKVSQSVPPTKRVADDVVVALDLENGTTLWKASLPGTPSGRTSSSTPCIKDGKLYAIGSKRIFCVEAAKGKTVWDTPLELEGIASSLMPYENLIIALVGNLRAYDKISGKLVWENKEISGKSASPSLWKTPGGDFIVCNGRSEVFLVEPKTGKTHWHGPGGGSSTPVCEKNWMLVHGKDEKVGLIAYLWKESKITEAWRFPKLTRRADSSPLIHDGHAYLIGAGMRACLDLETGKLIKKEMAKHDISSPVLVGGKILAYEINGSFLQLIETNPGKFGEISKAKIGALKCTSPSPVGSKLLIRKSDRIACYELAKKPPAQP
jgi:outer membrane protein assembly factor BamB